MLTNVDYHTYRAMYLLFTNVNNSNNSLIHMFTLTVILSCYDPFDSANIQRQKALVKSFC